MKSNGALLPSAAIVFSAALWGSMWIPLHALHDGGLPGTWIAFFVYGVPAFILAPWTLRRGFGTLWRHWRMLSLIGVFTGICNVFYAIGVVYGDVAMVILLFYLNPVWSAILERIALKSRISRWRACAVALGLMGMWVLVGGDGGLPLPNDIAEWMGLIAGFAWAVALVVMRVSGEVDQFDKAFSQYVCALLIGGIIIGTGIFPGEIAWGEVAWPRAFGIILAIGIIWVLPGLLLSFWGAARLSPTRASMLFMAEVIVGVGSAAFLGVSDLGWRHAIGGGLIVAAGLLDGLTDANSSEKAKA
jgi:drug/metabolite transporter (DMT)-like permease